LGRISYGLYLFHGVTPRLIGWLWSIVGVHAAYPPNALVGVGAPMLATVTLAALSWHVYEGPINQLKRYLPYDPRTTPAIHADGTHPRVSAV
jgi:peptidoglycan/LPS O-acetylase OafA/YrhL